MRYIVFDLEATCWSGLPPKGVSEIIEIGAVIVNRYGEVESSFSRFVRPIVNPLLSGYCKNLTTITQKNVDAARTFDKVVIDFIEWGEMYDEEYILLAWGDKDETMLRDDCRLHHIETDWTARYKDLKKGYQKLKGLSDSKGLMSVIKWEGFLFTGLPHRAISDAENLAKVFIKYLEDWDLHV